MIDDYDVQSDVILDEYDYFDLAEHKREEGDLLGSLIILRNIEESGTKELDVYAFMAEIFFDMEIYSLSEDYWFKYLAGSTRTDIRMKAYSGLGACFCMTMNNYVMGYYYDLEFSLDPQFEQQYDHVLFDYLEFNKEEYPDYYVYYSKDGLSSKNLYVSAVDLLEKGKISEAISRLSDVKPQSEYFGDAVTRAAYCMKDNNFDADDILSFLYEKLAVAVDKGKIALCICEMLPDGDDRRKACLCIALESDFEEPGDWFYVGYEYAKLKCYNECEKALKKALAINKYDVKSIYLYGVILYNQGLYERSAQYFKTGYDINRDQVNLFDLRLSGDEAARKIIPELPLYFGLPEREATDRFKRIAELITGSKSNIKKADSEELIALAEFGLSFINNIAADMIKYFMLCGSAKVKKFFIRKLISQNVENYDKMRIVEVLCLSGYDKKVDVVFDNIFLQVRLFRASFPSDDNFVFFEAYSFAVSRLFPFVKDTSVIRDTAYDIYYELERKRKLKKVKNYRALAAVITIESSVKKMEGEVLQKYFGAKEKDISDIYALLEG